MSGYVYLIGNPIFNWYKIGKSITPEIRIKDIGILLPFKIKVMSVWKAENHHLMESTMHGIYEKNRINGEWFEFTGDDIGRIIESIPAEARIYLDRSDKFSNIEEDTKNSKRVIGVRTQKLRGNFTTEERELLKAESMERKRKNKEAGLSNSGQLLKGK
jgi:Meiotically up-regulated gene 113